MDSAFTFAELDELSTSLAAWLQGKELDRGSRIAVMMPNLPQYMVAITAVLRADMSSSMSIRCTRRTNWNTSSTTQALKPSSSGDG